MSLSIVMYAMYDIYAIMYSVFIFGVAIIFGFVFIFGIIFIFWDVFLFGVVFLKDLLNGVTLLLWTLMFLIAHSTFTQRKFTQRNLCKWEICFKVCKEYRSRDMKYATRAIFPVVAYTQLLRAGPVASYDNKEGGNSKKAYQEKGLLQNGLLQKGLQQKGL